MAYKFLSLLLLSVSSFAFETCIDTQCTLGVNGKLSISRPCHSSENSFHCEQSGSSCVCNCQNEYGETCKSLGHASTGMLAISGVCDFENQCAGVTCHNGGSCVDGVNSYTCNCPNGYSGTHCSVTTQSPTNSPTNSPTYSPTNSPTARQSTAAADLCSDPSCSWSQLGQDIDGEAHFDMSGGAVALSSDGTVLASGARQNDGNGQNSGHVRVHEWDGSSWVQKGQDIDGEVSGDWSGTTVSLNSDGTVLAIGASRNDNGGTNTGSTLALGHVRVYTWNGNLWVQKGHDIDGVATGDQIGLALSLNGDGTVVAIGAHASSGNGATFAGNVKVYNWDENFLGRHSVWTQRGDTFWGNSMDFVGSEVSLSADGASLAVGAYGVNAMSGRVRVYNWDGTVWLQSGTDINGEAESDLLGYGMSLSADGSVVASGAPWNGASGQYAGHVRVHQLQGGDWVQMGDDIDAEAAGDQSGFEVSLSADGTVVAIGAPENNGRTGHVRVYKWNGSSWTQAGADIDGEAPGDRASTNALSLSADGSILAVGAPYNHGINGIASGHVRVYKME